MSPHGARNEPEIAGESTEYVSRWLVAIRPVMTIALTLAVLAATFGVPGIRVSRRTVASRPDIVVSGEVRLFTGETIHVVGRVPLFTFWRDGKLRYPVGRL